MPSYEGKFSWFMLNIALTIGLEMPCGSTLSMTSSSIHSTFLEFDSNFLMSLVGYLLGLAFGITAKNKGWSWIS